MNNKIICNKCKIDPTPMGIFGDSALIPCGLANNDFQFSGLHPSGCPMSDWQDGYVAGMRVLKEKELRDLEA